MDEGVYSMDQTEEILERLKQQEKVMIISQDQKTLEALFDEICEAGYRNTILPLFEEAFSKRELARELGKCLIDLHKEVQPLGKSILEVSRMIEDTKGEEINCVLPYIDKLALKDVEELADVLLEYEEVVKNLTIMPDEECWNGIQIAECSDEQVTRLKNVLPKLIQVFEELSEFEKQLKPLDEGEFLKFDWNHLEQFITLFEKLQRLQDVPVDWMFQSELNSLYEDANHNRKLCMDYMHIRNDISSKYEDALFDLDGVGIYDTLTEGIKTLTSMLRIHGQNDGFIIDNLRHIAERTDMLYANLIRMQQDVEKIKELTGGAKEATFENIPAFYQMADFLSHKPEGMKGGLSASQIQSAEESIHKLRQLYHAGDDTRVTLNERYTEAFFNLDTSWWMERFGQHAQIKKYMMGQKQIHLSDIRDFTEKMVESEQLIRASWEEIQKYDMKPFQIPDVKKVYDIDANLAICTAVLGKVTPNETWLNESERQELLYEIEDCERRCLQIRRLSYGLLGMHNEQVFLLDWEELLPKFMEHYQGFFKRLKGSYKQDRELVASTYQNVPENLSDEEILEVLRTLQTLAREREAFRQKKGFLVEHIGEYYHGENTNWVLLKADIKQFEEILECFETPEEAYRSIMAAADSRESLQQYYGALMTLRNAVRERASVFYQSSEFSMECIEDIAYRFAEMVLQAKKMEEDFLAIVEYRKDAESVDEISYQEVLRGLQSLDKWERDRRWIGEKEEELSRLFGNDFQREETEWGSLMERLKGIRNITESLDSEMCGKELTAFLENDHAHFSKEELSVEDYKGMLARIESELKSFLQVNSLDQLTIQEASSRLAKVKEMCQDMDDIFANVSRLCKRREYAKNMLEDLKQFSAMQKIEQQFDDDSQGYKKNYGILYQGVVTDWNSLCDKLKLAKSLKSDVGKYHLGRTVLEVLLDQQNTMIDCYTTLNVLTSASIYKEDFQCYSNLFEPELHLGQMEFHRVLTKLNNCYRTIDDIQQWCWYQQGRSKCEKYGLLSFLSAIEEKQLATEKIKESFLQTFYRKWLAKLLLDKGGMYPYRVRNQIEIQEMIELEKGYPNIGKMEIADYLAYVPNWLSRRKSCLLVSELSMESEFYARVEFLEER